MVQADDAQICNTSNVRCALLHCCLLCSHIQSADPERCLCGLSCLLSWICELLLKTGLYWTLISQAWSGRLGTVMPGLRLHVHL